MSFFDALMEDLEAAKRPDIQKKTWMHHVSMELVTVETLSSVIDACIASGTYALDLETTGLDNRVYNGRTVDQIVGVCLAPDPDHGYYIPLRHRNTGPCLPITLVENELRRLVSSASEAVFHNAKFDQEFLQFNGGEPIGTWDEPNWHDSMILKYLQDSRAKSKGLKHLSKVELDMEMIELDELFTEEEAQEFGKNFSVLDPTWDPALWYACSDAICTLRLYYKLKPLALDPTPSGLPGQKDVYKIERMCLAATRWMERNQIPISVEKVEELIRVGQREFFPALREVFDSCGKVLGRDISPGYMKVLTDPEDPLRFDPEDVSLPIMTRIDLARDAATKRHLDPMEPDERGKPGIASIQKVVPSIADPKQTETVSFPLVYDILIPDKLGLLLRELGVEGLQVTEGSGKVDAAGRMRPAQIKTAKDVLDALLEDVGDTFPYLAKVKRFREINKALASNLQPIYEVVRDKTKSPDGRVKINFNQMGTDTGRFSTPQEKEDRGWTGKCRWNLHSIPATYDKDRPECMKRIREVICAEEGRFIVTEDFSGQELRLITNLSGEPKWITEFFRCSGCGHQFDRGGPTPPPPEPPPPFCPKCGSDKIGDLHSLTAISVFGEHIKEDPKLFKDKRGLAKGINFGLSYGGGPSAIVRVVQCSKDEGYRIKRQFDGSYKVLQAWWKSQHEYARKHKAVITSFCRRYPLPDIDHEMGGFRAKAERNAVNGPIQGCLHPDSRVPTNRGMLTVKELWEQTGAGTEGLLVWTGSSWQKARPLFSGEKPVRETFLEDGGTMQTSPEHLFRVWAEGAFRWVRQDALKVGDWVARDAAAIDYPEPSYRFDDKGRAHNAHRFQIDGNSPTLWELLGRAIGDGSLREDGLILHVGEAPAHMQSEALASGYSAEAHATALAERIRRDVGVDPRVVCRAREPGDTRQPIWQVQIWNGAFMRFCTQVLGLTIAKTHEKRFPQALWSESIANRAAFLRGYFDADGGISRRMDHISVRSVNLVLLKDAAAVLRSVGVRAACRPKSLRTTVLDREAYRDIVGFSVEYKVARLVRMESNPQTHRNTRLPPDVVARIGDLLHASPGYAPLPRAHKSAVLRLRAGSGSKAQCANLIGMCGCAEAIPSDIEACLAYDYARVTAKNDPGTNVIMYDVEVLDDDHAFSCDGTIVHNTGADLNKLSMALVYREFKARGWLDRARLIITIHDELVFDVEASLLDEVVKVVTEIMIRKTVRTMPWRVPMTSDVEVGHDWTVPWNIGHIRHGKAPMPSELEGLIALDAENRPPVAAASPSENRPAAVSAPAREDGPRPVEVARPQEVSATPSRLEAESRPRVEGGNVFVYRIERKRLTVTTANRLAKVIDAAAGRGSSLLQVVVAETGEPLWTEPPVYVNPIEFEVLMNARNMVL